MRPSTARSFGFAAVLFISVLSSWTSSSLLRAADCDRNGIDDRLDLRPGPSFPGPSLLLRHDNTVSTDLVIADLDGDGRIDVASPDGGGVAVVLNRGGGRFASPANWPAARRVAALAGADLDGDGSVDLAAAAESGGIAVLRNSEPEQELLQAVFVLLFVEEADPPPYRPQHAASLSSAPDGRRTPSVGQYLLHARS